MTSRSLAASLLVFATLTGTARSQDEGTLPVDAQSRPLNLDFERGDLRDWTPEGEAFTGQPIEGDTVSARRSDMKSGHQGRFWVGTFERGGDAPKGTLTSTPFLATKPFASFLISGGTYNGTRVELVRHDSGEVVFKAVGDDSEELKRVVADLGPHQGQLIFIRLVDQKSSGWGHINFDDFRLHDTKPTRGLRLTPRPTVCPRGPSRPRKPPRR